MKLINFGMGFPNWLVKIFKVHFCWIKLCAIPTRVRTFPVPQTSVAFALHGNNSRDAALSSSNAFMTKFAGNDHGCHAWERNLMKGSRGKGCWQTAGSNCMWIDYHPILQSCFSRSQFLIAQSEIWPFYWFPTMKNAMVQDWILCSGQRWISQSTFPWMLPLFSKLFSKMDFVWSLD